MKKRFTPIFYIVIILAIYVILPAVGIPISWCFINSKSFNICCTVILGGIGLMFPFVLYANRNNASIVLTDRSLENYINDKTDNFGWIEELENVKSVKITTKEECQKYYKNCNSKKVILIDFGNGNVKYIPLTYFTKRQSRRIVKTIEENVERIKQTKHSA